MSATPGQFIGAVCFVLCVGAVCAAVAHGESEQTKETSNGVVISYLGGRITRIRIEADRVTCYAAYQGISCLRDGVSGISLTGSGE